MGTVVLSIDAELGWGFHDLQQPPRERVENGRRGWPRLLSILEEYEVPATWAVVGHLMLDRCDRTHATHPAPDGWFERERTDWRDRSDLRFAPDLVRATLESPVTHELGCHSFSHVLFGSPETTGELARAECRRCQELADGWLPVTDDRAYPLQSFVYPRNDVGHRDALVDTGFRVYRGRMPTPDGPRGVFDTIVRRRSLLVHPTIDEYGLVNVPASTFAFRFEGVARTAAETLWRDPMVVLAKRGIDEAVTGNGVFHLWLHPNNLVTERDDERMREIIAYVDRRRSETDLRVETMGQVGRRVRAESDASSLASVPED